MKLQAWTITLLAMGIALSIPSISQAQRVMQTPLRGNPYRDGGGSCVYDRNGVLVHTPRGKDCRDRSDHSGSEGTEVFTSLIEGYPPALQSDLRKLLGDHQHISAELTKLRQTIQAGERAEALDFADRVEVEVADHRRREEEFLSKLASLRKRR